MTHTSSTGLHDWPCIALAYRIVASPSAPLLEVSITLDSSRLPIEFEERGAVQAEYASLAEWFASSGEDAGRPFVAINTGGAITAGPSSQAANGSDLADALAAFTARAADWLASPTGAAPDASLTITTSLNRPAEWPSDLHPLTVTVSINADWASVETVVPPAQDMAATLESAFESYNGAGSSLKVAFGDAIETWLCRWGTGGTSVSFRKSEPPVFWAMPPFSHAPVSAIVDGRTYQNVDLRHWLGAVLEAVQTFATSNDAAARVRARLAAAVARSLVPVFRTPGDLPNTAAAIDGVAAHLARDLTLPIACVMQVPASAQSSVGSDAHPAPAWRLHGDVIDASPDAANCRLSTAGVPLTAGDPSIEILVSVDDSGGRNNLALEPSFRVTGLASTETTLRFALPVVVPVGVATCPLPLASLPAAPRIARAIGAQDEPDSSADFAKLWAFGVSLADAFPAHDTLAIDVRLNPAAVDVPVTPAATTAQVMPLFEAVARFLAEWPTGPTLERALGLAANVCGALEAWSPAPDGADGRARSEEPFVWRYRCEGDREAGVLTLHGEPSASGSPIWPAIEGYAQDAVEHGALSATYRREGSDVRNDLNLTWSRLAARGISHVAAGARVDRNRRVAPAGTPLPPAFLTSSATVMTPAVERPPLVAGRPVVLPPASTLEASLAALLQDVIAIPRGAHLAGDPPGAEARITIAYSFVVAGEIRSSIPVLQGEIPLTGDLAADTVRTLAGRLEEWRTSVSPQGTAQFVVSLALFFLEPEAGPQPAVRIPEVIIPIVW